MATYQTYELSEYEKRLTYLCLGGLSGSTVLVLDSEENLDKSLLISAFKYMQKRHPFLRSHQILNEKNGDMSIQVPINYDENKYADLIELEYSLNSNEKRTRNDMIRELEELNDKLFVFDNEEKLMWRLKATDFYENNKHYQVIIFVIAIQITDGINIVTLMVELINILNSLKQNKTCDEMKECLELVDGIHKTIEKQNLFNKEKHQAIIDGVSRETEPADLFVFDKKFSSSTKSGTTMHLFKIDENQTTKLIQLSKKYDFKLTGLLTAAAFYSLKEFYSENGLELSNKLSANVAANFRIRYSPNLNFSHMGFHVSVVDTFEDLSKHNFTNIMEDAKYLDKIIHEATDMETGTIFKSTHTLDYLKKNNELCLKHLNDKKKLCQILAKSKTADLFVSNTGKYVWNAKKITENEPFKLKEVYFGDSLSSSPAMVSPLMIHVSFWDGQLFFHLGGNNSSIDSVYFKRFASLYELKLNSLN